MDVKQVCELCRQSVDDEIKYGKFMKNEGISVHYYCLLLSSNLVQHGEEDESFLGFLVADIIHEAKRVKSQVCFYCREGYANVSCCSSKCRKTFHLSCGIENGAISHFTGTYQTFCPEHVKWNRTEKPREDEICLICYENLDKFNKFFIIQSPCCKTGWFHRWCLASFALTAGYFFKCPKCNDMKIFRKQVVRKGIFIPDQDAAWELESNAFAELLERPNECTAENCLCPHGRLFNKSKYSLILCHTCGSKAIHANCIDKNMSSTFVCVDCLEVSKNLNLNNDTVFKENDQVDADVDNDGDVNIMGDTEDEFLFRCSNKKINENDDRNVNSQNYVLAVKQNKNDNESENFTAIGDDFASSSIDVNNFLSKSKTQQNDVLNRKQQNFVLENNLSGDRNIQNKIEKVTTTTSQLALCVSNVESTINKQLETRQEQHIKKVDKVGEVSSSILPSSVHQDFQNESESEANKAFVLGPSNNSNRRHNRTINPNTLLSSSNHIVQLEKPKCSDISDDDDSFSSTQNSMLSTSATENQKVKRRKVVKNYVKVCNCSSNSDNLTTANAYDDNALRRKLRKRKTGERISYCLRNRSSSGLKI